MRQVLDHSEIRYGHYHIFFLEERKHFLSQVRVLFQDKDCTPWLCLCHIFLSSDLFCCCLSWRRNSKRCYESSRTLEKVLAAWGAGFSLPGRGVSPNPGRGQPPSALPLLAWGHIGFFRPQKNSG